MRAVITVRWSGPDGGGCEDINIECTEQEYQLIKRRLPDLRAQADYQSLPVDELEITPYREPTVVSAHQGTRMAAELAGVEDWLLLPE